MAARLLFLTVTAAGPGWAASPPAPSGDTGPPLPTGDTGARLDVDEDGDGVTIRQGDCDDTTALAAPGLAEVCEDQLDNDCDGLYDEECDVRIRMATLRGGGGCTGSFADGRGTVALMFLPLIAIGRRRS